MPLSLPLELIGEEIYDEFDPQGHPDLKSYVPNEKTALSAIKRKISAPELVGNATSTVPTSTATVTGITNREMTKSLMATPLIKPIPLPALKGLNFKGLGFARSRSAPPTPRDERQPSVGQEKGDSTPATVPEGCLPDETLYGEDDYDAKMTSELDKIDRASSPEMISASTAPAVLPYTIDTLDIGAHASPGVGRTRSSAAVTTAATPLRAPVPVPVSATTLAPLANAPLVPPVMTSRSSSPAPSLEQAILAERMRRAVAGASSSPAPKGGRFKSSPLTGDRVGVVVAERVKREMWTNDASGGGSGYPVPARTLLSEKDGEDADVD